MKRRNGHGSVARVWVETAAGNSSATTASLSGSCAGALSLDFVQLGNEDAMGESGVSGASDAQISMQVTISRSASCA